MTLCIVYAITAVKGGGSFWQQSMLQTVGIGKHEMIPDYFYEMPWNQWFMVYGGLVLVGNTVQRYAKCRFLRYIMVKKYELTVFSAMHVMDVQREQKKDVIKPLYGLIPYFVSWSFIPTYLYLQPVILEYHLIPFVFYVGLINAYSVGLMIVAHLTQDPTFPMYNVLTIPLGLAVLDSAGPFLGLWPSALGYGTYQIAFVFMCVGFGFGVYGSFVVSRHLKFAFKY